MQREQRGDDRLGETSAGLGEIFLHALQRRVEERIDRDLQRERPLHVVLVEIEEDNLSIASRLRKDGRVTVDRHHAERSTPASEHAADEVDAVKCDCFRERTAGVEQRSEFVADAAIERRNQIRFRVHNVALERVSDWAR